MDTHLPVSAAANEPTTLPLPFPDQPSELGDLPDGAANEPPVELDALAPPPVSRPPREPRFDWQPGWRGQDAKLEREALFARLSTRWREERRRRYLEAVLTAQPAHELPYRPYGDPTPGPLAG